MDISRRFTGGVEEFLDGGPRLWAVDPKLTDRELAGLQSFSLQQAEARLEYAHRMGWTVLTPETPGYPEALKNIYDPPAVLYIKGSLPEVDRTLSIAIVGARKASEESLKAARLIGYQLALGGACVISGGALGIDSAALRGALEIPDARVVSVLPVSLESPYIHQNAKLRELVAQNGALVTEYFSQQTPDYGTFPQRNRLITGLARGVVLIQAAAKSGTLLYAKRAEEQDRDVLVYPGTPGDPAFAGSESLIEDGCPAVRDGNEIFREYREAFSVPEEGALQQVPKNDADALRLATNGEGRRAAPAKEQSVKGRDLVPELSAEQKVVLAALSERPESLEILTQKTDLPLPKLLVLLTELELLGLTQSFPGKRFARTPGVELLDSHDQKQE